MTAREKWVRVAVNPAVPVCQNSPILSPCGVKRKPTSARAVVPPSGLVGASPAGQTAGSRLRPVRTSPWVLAGDSPIHGKGLYARCDIPDGTRVIEYVGEKITKAEAERREQRRRAAQQRGAEAGVSIFQLNGRYDLDGRVPGNVARLMNHSCQPNCRADNIRGRIWLVARRDILAGEELSFDYGYALEHWALHPCRCGKPRCAGYIVGAAQRWRLRRKLRDQRRTQSKIENPKSRIR